QLVEKRHGISRDNLFHVPRAEPICDLACERQLAERFFLEADRETLQRLSRPARTRCRHDAGIESATEERAYRNIGNQVKTDCFASFMPNCFLPTLGRALVLGVKLEPPISTRYAA